MGTNYYAHLDACPTCGKGEEMHIGKSSGGWRFMFHIYPERGINSWASWQAKLRLSRAPIKDEYGKTHTLEDFHRLVESKAAGQCHACDYPQHASHDSDHNTIIEGEFS